MLAALLLALPTGALEIEWVHVGDPGNPPDTATNCLNAAADCGSVPEEHYVSKYEITNTQYAEFLNAAAASDPLGLYNPCMGLASHGGILRSGAEGSYAYAAKLGFEDRPVNYVSFDDAIRFANWLDNGQGSGDSETGAYTITAGGIAANTITRNPGAIAFLPNENEWYKAAYYDAALAAYHDYPAGSDAPTACTGPGPTPNTANCGDLTGGATDVGAYPFSGSPYGTFDQGGNVLEWNETARGSDRGIRGGGWLFPASLLLASVPDALSPAFESFQTGFRVASLVPVPEPAHALLLATGALVLLGVRRVRATAQN